MHRTIVRSLAALFVFSAVAGTSSFLKAQGTPSEGQDFFVGMLYPSYQNVAPFTSSNFFKVYVLISSFQDNTAYLSYFDRATGVEMGAASYPIKKRQTVQIPLVVPNLRMTDPGDQIKEYCALHIWSKKPINVQFFSSGPASCGSYLALPTNGLGRKYVIASYNDNPKGKNSHVGGHGPSAYDTACGYFMIIAPYDGTTVNIIPADTTQGGKHRDPYAISLNRAQCYMVKSSCKTPSNDISGTIVESDKPIGVIAGHEDAALGGLSGRPLEGRDYMVEQMVPVDYWDTTGYVSMPLVDSSPLGPNDEGPGDNYRVYTYDTNGTAVRLKLAGEDTSHSLNVGRLTTREDSLIETPVHFFSVGGKPFGVMLYDQANQSSTGPFPRPSMMTILPMSRWRNGYTWFAPPNLSGERLHYYYVNIIGPKALFDTGIHVSKNGGSEVSVGSIGQSMGSYQTFPDHPELKGVRYKISSGVTYYARANFPFMVYSYGHRAVDYDGDLGDFDDDDDFFSYALPVGMVLASGAQTNMSVKIDTLCSGWKITVTDHYKGGGISSAMLLDDPFGDMVIPPFIDSTNKAKRDTIRQPSGTRGFQFSNCSFDKVLDPLGKHQIIFTGNDSTVSFEVQVGDISADAYAPIYVADNEGNPEMIPLTFKKSFVAYQPEPDTDCYFGLRYVSDVKDSTFIFTNLASSQRSYIVNKVELVKNDSAFRILSVTPPLSATIKPGDTLFIKVRFTAIDTSMHLDTVKMVSDCFTALTPVSGEGGTPLIVAADHDFGNVGVGSKKCVDTIRVWNIGKLPFTLTSNYKLYDNVNFSIDSTYPQPGGLPVTLLPGKFVRLRFCFKPTKEGPDTTRNDWGTDILPPYQHDIKDYSILRGNGIQPGVIWDRARDSMLTDSVMEKVHRIWLMANATAASHVKDVYLTGPDASDFRIVAWQLAQPTFDFFIDTGAKVWFDVGFKPDLSKPYGLRTAYLNASTWDDTITRVVILNGNFGKEKVKEELKLAGLSIHPNPSRGGNMTADFSLASDERLEFVIFDVLGREVLRLGSEIYSQGKNSVELPVGKLPPGSYHLRITSSEGVATRMIEVVK